MVADNGTGCDTFTDGMGIAGMRRRIREVMVYWILKQKQDLK